jgi:putative tricarboxylic transport membrane protein
LLAALQIFNLQPGPLLFERSSVLVWTLIASLYIGNVMLLILNYPLIRIWVKLLAIPKELLYSGIPLFATLGVYSLSNSVVDLLVMYAIGVLGFFMPRYDFPVGPVIIGVILGPLMEAQFRRALQVSQKDPTIFFTRPLSLTILLLALVAHILPYLPALIKRLRGERPEQDRLIFGEGKED